MSKGSRQREKRAKDAWRQQQHQAKETRMKNPSGGSDYAKKTEAGGTENSPFNKPENQPGTRVASRWDWNLDR